MTNIVQFPINAEMPDIEIEEFNEDMFVEDLAETISDKMMEFLVHHGFEIGDDDFIDDFTFAVEAFKSAMYRSMNLDHPMHPIVDEFLDILDEEG